MRLSDFWERMELALGPGYARSWAQDMVLPSLGCTVNQAIDQGVDTTQIWRAVCEAVPVPPEVR